MHEQHVEALRKADILRSGGSLSDESDESDEELGLADEDEVDVVKSLAAKADRLIALGDFDGAERLLADAEKAEVAAGLAVDVT